jgi:hypothetical protein
MGPVSFFQKASKPDKNLPTLQTFFFTFAQIYILYIDFVWTSDLSGIGSFFGGSQFIRSKSHSSHLFPNSSQVSG